MLYDGCIRETSAELSRRNKVEISRKIYWKIIDEVGDDDEDEDDDDDDENDDDDFDDDDDEEYDISTTSMTILFRGR